jgi:hypothetical protein
MGGADAVPITSQHVFRRRGRAVCRFQRHILVRRGGLFSLMWIRPLPNPSGLLRVVRGREKYEGVVGARAKEQRSTYKQGLGPLLRHTWSR